MPTINGILQTVEKLFGKSNRQLKEILAVKIEEKINDLARGGDFNFCATHPDLSFLNNFPVDSSTLSAGTLRRKGYWMSQGWLSSEPGVDNYLIYTPNYLSTKRNALGAETYAPFSGAPLEAWATLRVSHIKEMHKVDITTGSLYTPMAVLSNEEFTSVYSQNDNSPLYATLFDTIEGTNIKVHPTPIDYEIYRVSYSLAELHPLTGPESSNAFIENYPEFCVNLGLLIFAEFFGDIDKALYYERKLYGDPANPRFSGLMGDVIEADERKSKPGGERKGLAWFTTSNNPKLPKGMHFSSSGGWFPQ